MKNTTKIVLASSVMVIAGQAFAWGGGFGGDATQRADYSAQHQGSSAQPFFDGQRHERRHQQRQENRIQRLVKRLGLSDEQRTQVMQIFERGQESRQALKKQFDELQNVLVSLDANDDQYAQQLNAAKQKAADLAVERIEHRVNVQQSLAAVLSEEQLEKLKMMHERRSRF